MLFPDFSEPKQDALLYWIFSSVYVEKTNKWAIVTNIVWTLPKCLNSYSNFLFVMCSMRCCPHLRLSLSFCVNTNICPLMILFPVGYVVLYQFRSCAGSILQLQNLLFTKKRESFFFHRIFLTFPKATHLYLAWKHFIPYYFYTWNL